MAASEKRLVSKPAVLLVCLAKYYGGAEVRVFNIANALKNQIRFAVVVLESSPLHKKLQAENLPVIPLKFNRSNPYLIFSLANIIRKGNYLVVDTHNPQSHLWGLLAAKLAGVKTIVTTVHGCYGEAEQGWRALLYDNILRLNNRLGSQFIAVSEAVIIYLNKLLHSQSNINSIYLIENAIGCPANTQNINVRELCGWQQNAIVVIVAARLEPVKGLNHLLEAMALASQSQPALKLCIIGTGRCLAELQTQTKTLNIENLVSFTGFRQDVMNLFKEADIFCLPSLSEGLPYAVLEAALCRLPLLISQVGGMATLFEHDKTAYFFPPKDDSALCQALLKLANDVNKRVELGEAAYQFVKNKFSPEIMLQATLKVYSEETENV